jgi:hypothetical protein
VLEIGESVVWQGRSCHVRGVAPASLPGQLVELEEAETQEWHSVPLNEMEGLVGSVWGHEPVSPSEFPH